MVTSYQLIRFWRVIILAMLMISFVGSWFLDLIWVPVENDCAPNIRLDENFCGVSNSFAMDVSSILTSDISSINSGVFRNMTVEELSREYSFRFLFFVAILPLPGSLLAGIGWLGRSAALLLTLLLSSSLTPYGTDLPVLVLFGIAATLMLTGTGPLSLWSPEEGILYRRNRHGSAAGNGIS